MKRTHRLNRAYAEARMVHYLQNQPCIKDVVVKTAIEKIILRAIAEILEASRLRIHFEIVKLQNLGKMRGVVLGNVKLKVPEEMPERCHRSAVVEGAVLMWNNQDEYSIWPQ